MYRFASLGFLLCMGWVSVVIAQQFCPALRVLETTQTQYFVLCDTGPVEISVGEYNANKRKGGAPWATYCTDGTTAATATAELRWNTPSGLPAACDAWSNVKDQAVQTASVFYVTAPDGLEIEVQTAVNAPIWSGQELLGFTPPLPGLSIGTQP